MFWELFCIGNIITDIGVVIAALTIFLTQVYQTAGGVAEGGPLGRLWNVMDKVDLKRWWWFIFAIFSTGIIMEVAGTIL